MSHVGSGFPIEGVLERQLKSWRLEAVRNGAHRPDCETRPGSLDQMPDFFPAEPLWQALDLSRIRGLGRLQPRFSTWI